MMGRSQIANEEGWTPQDQVAAEDVLNHTVLHTSFLNSDAEMIVVLTSF